LDFTYSCLTIDMDLRPTVLKLLEHPFLQKACGTEKWAQLVDLAKKMKAEASEDEGAW
jgi:hypothetical protein